MKKNFRIAVGVLALQAPLVFAHPGHGVDVTHLHSHDVLMTLALVVAAVVAIGIARRK
jgi:hypothetical protein